MERNDCEKILGVKIDYKLKFDKHVKTLCSKANRALARATPYINVDKKENTDELHFQQTVQRRI